MKKTLSTLATTMLLTSVLAIPVGAEAAPKSIQDYSVPAISATEMKEAILVKLTAKLDSKEQKTEKASQIKFEDFTKNSNDSDATVKPPTQKELDARTGVESNDDNERRSALEKKYKIKLTEKMIWPDKKGQVSVDPDGIEREFTSHDEMKSLGFYAVNANRQELIQYGIQTNDWQPYRAFEAESTPGYFKIVNGKYEYTKVYYANDVKNYKSWLFETDMEYKNGDITKERYEELKKVYTYNFNEALKNFKKAPGVVPYIVTINHTSELAEEHGIPEADFSFFNGVNGQDFLQGLITEEDILAAKKEKELKDEKLQQEQQK